MAANTALSPAGQYLQLGGSPASLANTESDGEKKRRLAQIAAAQAKLSAGKIGIGTTPGSSTLSAAGSLLGLGSGYSGI